MTDAYAADHPSAPSELEASAQVLTLPPGVYLISVEGGSENVASGDLAVPALQMGIAPRTSRGEVEFLAGAGTLDRWLTHSTDLFIVRISKDDSSLLLTSLRSPGGSALTVNIQKLVWQPEDARGEPAVGTRLAAGEIPVRLMAHIENFGDVDFDDGRAGFIRQKLRIEAFTVASVDGVVPDWIEYRGVTADGIQTPWLPPQMLCGSRGRAVPLTGFAVRLKPEASSRYRCLYTGKFLSGRTMGPFDNAELCSSDVSDDPLEGIELRIVERDAAELGGQTQEKP